MLRVVVLALLATALLTTGCEGSAASAEGADLTSGKELFVQQCGACHVLSDAGTQGVTGPNLDHAYGYVREQDFGDESTLFNVVLRQIDVPAPPMPPDLVVGEDAIDVAAYVARCAGIEFAPEEEQAAAGCPGPLEPPSEAANGEPEDEGAALFTSAGCGGCHTFAAAGAGGQTAVSLDESDASVEQAAEQIREGGGGMPAFEGQLTDDEIDLLARYVVENRPER